jgi:cyanophycinase-like exopeptidase
VIEQLLNAEAIWIAGGDQFDYVSFWQGTPVEDAINNFLGSGAATNTCTVSHLLASMAGALSMVF